MNHRLPPAEIDMPVEDVDTPALLVDLDAFERNVARMAAFLGDGPAKLRGHAKTHKCPDVAKAQIAAGAVGVCCQKVSEAQAMIEAGIDNVLVSNEVVGARKLERLAALNRSAWVGVCADDASNVDAIDAAAKHVGVRIPVLVEINNGAGRCGVAPGEPAVALAQRIDASAHLDFTGLQAYHGRAQHVRSAAERRATAEAGIALTTDTVARLRAAGLECAIVGGAGTGTVRFDAGSGCYNEVQAGSYVFMDADYARNLDEDGNNFDEFEHSLFVYATVMSRPEATRAYLDTGLKAFSVDSGMPVVDGRAGLRVDRASDEHGNLVGDGGVEMPPLGEKLRLIPGHCDPTVNLYDWYVGIRGQRVECLWPISARGPSY